MSESLARDDVLRLAYVVEAGTFFLACLLGWLLNVSPLATFELRLVDLGWSLAATAPLLLGFWWSTHARWAPLAEIRAILEATMLPAFRQASLLDLLAVSVLAGVGEEALFRGVIQGGLTGPLPLWIAIAIASLVFGLVHLVTPAYAVLATLIGIYLGVVWSWTGNILVPITVHALYDFLALIYLTRVIRPRPTFGSFEEDYPSAKP